jgi:hypothetical protein
MKCCDCNADNILSGCDRVIMSNNIWWCIPVSDSRNLRNKLGCDVTEDFLFISQLTKNEKVVPNCPIRSVFV